MVMKRIILFAAMVVLSVAAMSQAPLSFGGMYGGQSAFPHFSRETDSNSLQKKWSLTKYGGLSTGFIAFKGGSASYLSAPVGLQLNRQLTNNLYAFAGLEVAPTFLHYNSAFYQPGGTKNNGFMNANNFGVYTAARMGLLYVNDDRTFSISGSIGVGRNNRFNNGYSPSYNPGFVPGYAPAYNPAMKNLRQ